MQNYTSNFYSNNINLKNTGNEVASNNHIYSTNSNNININNSQNSNTNYDNWKNFESKKRMEEALRRLNVDEQRCKNKNLVNFGIDYLMAEKNKVKSELKRFDNDFFELFGL